MSRDRADKNKDQKIELNGGSIPIPSNRKVIRTVEDYFSNSSNEGDCKLVFVPGISPSMADLIREKSNISMKDLDDFELGRTFGALGTVSWEYNRRLEAFDAPAKSSSLNQSEKDSIYLSAMEHSKKAIKSYLDFMEVENSNDQNALDKETSDETWEDVEDEKK